MAQNKHSCSKKCPHPHFAQSGICCRGMVPSAVQMGLPIATSIIKMATDRKAERTISLAFLESVS